MRMLQCCKLELLEEKSERKSYADSLFYISQEIVCLMQHYVLLKVTILYYNC